MGKFVLSELKEKVKRFAEERRTSVLSKAIVGSEFTLNQQYKLFFWGMNGFVSGNPSKKHRLVWNALIVNVVDSESVCDDVGFEIMKLKERCKLIGKEKPVSVNSIKWIETELKKYFEDSLNKQVTNINDALREEIIKGIITDDESKKAYAVYSKNTNAFRGALK
jgi:hypothetical protein